MPMFRIKYATYDYPFDDLVASRREDYFDVFAQDRDAAIDYLCFQIYDVEVLEVEDIDAKQSEVPDEPVSTGPADELRE